jgi:hypothetical protein
MPNVCASEIFQIFDRALMTIYHPKPEHLIAIGKRGFSKNQSRDFKLLQRLIPFPAVLDFAGFPKLRNQQCFAHKGGTGTSLSFFPHKDNGHRILHCNGPACGIGGDVVQFWFQLIRQIRLQPASWCLPQAAGDLLARVDSGEIAISSKDFAGESATSKARGHARPPGQGFTSGDGHWERLAYLITRNKGHEIKGSMRLPQPIRLTVAESILALFPENRYLMLANEKQGHHPIKMRNVWLSGCYQGPTLATCSFGSQNYCSRQDVDGTSYAAFEGDG